MDLQFSTEVRAALAADAISSKGADLIEELYRTSVARQWHRIRALEISPVAKLPVKILTFSQVSLCRVLSLTESFIRETNATALLAPFLTARAALETSCLMYDVISKARELVETDETAGLADLDDRTNKALLGGKATSFRFDIMPESLNVL